MKLIIKKVMKIIITKKYILITIFLLLLLYFFSKKRIIEGKGGRGSRGTTTHRRSMDDDDDDNGDSYICEALYRNKHISKNNYDIMKLFGILAVKTKKYENVMMLFFKCLKYLMPYM